MSAEGKTAVPAGSSPLAVITSNTGPGALVHAIRLYIQASRDRLKRAIGYSVPIAAGSDMYIIYPGKERGQACLAMIRAYAEAGMSSLAPGPLRKISEFERLSKIAKATRSAWKRMRTLQTGLLGRGVQRSVSGSGSKLGL